MRILERAVIVAALLLLATGCASPLGGVPAGWPKLDVTEHLDTPKQMVEQKCSGEGYIATFACTVVDLCQRTADIFYTSEHHTPDIIDHERGHTEGRDHWFASTMADALKAYQAGVCGPTAVKQEDEVKDKTAFTLLLLL